MAENSYPRGTALWPCQCGKRPEIARSDATREVWIECYDCATRGQVTNNQTEAVLLWNAERRERMMGTKRPVEEPQPQYFTPPISVPELLRAASVYSQSGASYSVRVCPYCNRIDRFELHWDGVEHQVWCHGCGARGPKGPTTAGSVDGWNGFKQAVLPRDLGPQRRIKMKRSGVPSDVPFDLKKALKSISESTAKDVAIEVRRDGSPVMRMLGELTHARSLDDRDTFQVKIGLHYGRVEYRADRTAVYSAHLILGEKQGAVYMFDSRQVTADAHDPFPVYVVLASQLAITL